ncbi:hypothetical protein RN001_002037 [Aquatica leii]|uniref:Uncharacterized protein n=1 Tax=Aquatica leii TaxID=1421715 RepID=A0AAN7SD15_9COLE|nr:hypothetical protein RN001_002037 [Aquatica leii]
MICNSSLLITNIMHEVFGTKPWMEPLAIAGSSVDIGHSKTVDITNRENEEPKASKKRKVNDVVEDYFQKSIQLKEEKERNAQKIHKEKMAYLEKIESFMTKMFKK